MAAIFPLSSAFAQPAAQPAAQPGQLAGALRNDRSTFLVRCEVNHKTGSYREGDALSAKVACEVRGSPAGAPSRSSTRRWTRPRGTCS
jgi:hypothetical protein